MRRKVLLIALPLLLLASACGPDGVEGDPKDALVRAVNALGEAPGLTLTMSVNSDTESLRALGKEDQDRLSEEDAQKILDSSVALSATNEQDPKKAQAEIAVNVGGREDAVEFKVLGTTIYLRADVRGLMEDFGQDPAQADQFVQQASSTGIAFVEPAVNGEWLKIDGLDKLVEQITGQPFPKQPNAQQKKAVERLGDEIEQSAKVTEGDREGPGAHLRATLNLRESYRIFTDIIRQSGQPLPPGALPPQSEVPNKDVTIDTWVEDDFLRRVELDLVQVFELADEEVPEGVETFALRLDIEEFTGPVEAPADAVTIDPQEIFNLFLGGPSQTITESGTIAIPPGQGDICAQLEDAPPEVIAQFSEECPDLQKK